MVKFYPVDAQGNWTRYNFYTTYTGSADAVFSFDPNSPDYTWSGAWPTYFNTSKMLPEGDYFVEIVPQNDTDSSGFHIYGYYSPIFRHEYNTDCQDYFTKASTRCATYDFKVYPNPEWTIVNQYYFGQASNPNPPVENDGGRRVVPFVTRRWLYDETDGPHGHLYW